MAPNAEPPPRGGGGGPERRPIAARRKKLPQRTAGPRRSDGYSPGTTDRWLADRERILGRRSLPKEPEDLVDALADRLGSRTAARRHLARALAACGGPC